MAAVAQRLRGSGGRRKAPLEYSILHTATLCLLAGGAVMVYSASSAESLLQGPGDPSHYLKRYLAFAALGLVVLHVLSRRGLAAVRAATPLLLAAGFALTAAVMLPGVGVTVNGATRWLHAGPIQFQPAELLKLALVLYAARLLAARPSAVGSIEGMAKPLLLIVGAACLLLLAQPDMGTAIVICVAVLALLLVAGASVRDLGLIVASVGLLGLVVALFEPYRRARLTAFLDPWSDAGDTGYQAVQALIGIGSGGLLGVGLGESVQKIFYLPEAHTDMILAIVGEEVGVLGILAVVALFGMIAYAGLRTARLARDRYSKLLAAGITALIVSQAIVNMFAVMGLAPLTGIPLPLVSYGASNLVVVLAGMGLLMNVAATGGRAERRLRVVSGGRNAQAEEGGGGARARRSSADLDRRGRDRGARRARAGGRRRAAG